jgi:L-rhamnose isomerase
VLTITVKPNQQDEATGEIEFADTGHRRGNMDALVDAAVLLRTLRQFTDSVADAAGWRPDDAWAAIQKIASRLEHNVEASRVVTRGEQETEP